MKKSPFFFGQRTTVLAVTVMEEDACGSRDALRCALGVPFHGYVVGAVRRYTGDLVWSEIDKVYRLKNRRSVLLWKVAAAMLSKPVEAQACDMVPEIPVGAWFPRLYPSWVQQLGFNKAVRYSNDLREAVSKAPRDAKGRWLKAQPVKVPEGSPQ